MKFWQHLLSKLQAEQNVYLLTVIANEGSSPGRKGFKMLIAEDGFIHGSIGGGVMEFKLVEEAKELLQADTQPILLKKQIHRGHKEHGSGMICSGEQTVVFHPLDSSKIPMINELVHCLANYEQGQLSITCDKIEFTKDVQEQKFECKIESDIDWIFKEQIGAQNTLYLVGGGHVSMAVSALFVTLGFHVVVFDNRENLNTLELNETAHQKQVVDFNNIKKHIVEGKQSYVAIMTNKYTDDKRVLSQLLRTDLAYIGVLGSKAKLEVMWEVLRREGFTDAELDKVYAPIGIPIKSQTPNEIAVSIAAELIKIKNINE
ncbi:XdhC family protein [Saprospiraceae bacterium]|nr:XdhC family protein [Saprospiraceae bacterium]